MKPGLPDLTCGRCNRTDPRIKVNGVETEPPGWSCVTLSGLPVRNVVLCPPCTDLVRDVLDYAKEEAAPGRHAISDQVAALRVSA